MVWRKRVIQDKKTSDPDVFFLVLARQADSLCALTCRVIPHRLAPASFCSSVYDAIAALHTLGPDRPVILITRPSMLAVPHLSAVLQRYPNLRLIGWIGPDENLVQPTAPALSALPIVTVGTREQLAGVITAIDTTFLGEQILNDPQPPRQDPKIAPADYRLSNEELNALLGVGK